MSGVSTLTNQESYVRAVAEVISQLIKAYEAQVAINLSKIKSEISKKHKLGIRYINISPSSNPY